MNFKFLTLLLVLPLVGHTQTLEPAWRVINSISPTTLPDYNAEPNPFPMLEKPKDIVVETIDYEALAKAETRATLISQLRQIILSNTAYTPNLGGYKVRGYLQGRGGAKVLIGKNWMAENETFTVSINGTERVLSMLSELNMLDPKTGVEMSKEIQRIIPDGSSVKIKITNITPEKVTLRDEKGHVYSLKVN